MVGLMERVEGAAALQIQPLLGSFCVIRTSLGAAALNVEPISNS